MRMCAESEELVVGKLRLGRDLNYARLVGLVC